jgi:hypothetical protein
MRIINTLPHPQHYSYASTGKGGRTLNPGESSPELPLVGVHNPQLAKSLAAGSIQLRLSEADIQFMTGLIQLAAAPDKKVKVAVKPAKPKKPAKKAKTSGKKSPPIPVPLGQPDFSTTIRVIDEADAGEVDLAALQGSNKLSATQQKRLDEVKGMQSKGDNKLNSINEFTGSKV